MPKWKAFRNICSMAWTCTSPPGAPNGITLPSSRTAIAGLGVRRGRLPGPTPDGWLGSGRLCVPRPDGTMPRPGITGLRHEPSLGVADMALPQRSTAQQYEVSGSTTASLLAVDAAVCG